AGRASGRTPGRSEPRSCATDSDPSANGSVLAGRAGRDGAAAGSRPGGSADGESPADGPGGRPRRAGPGGRDGGPGCWTPGVPAEGPEFDPVSGWAPKAAATSAAPAAAASGAASRRRVARSNPRKCGTEPGDPCPPPNGDHANSTTVLPQRARRRLPADKRPFGQATTMGLP